MTDINHVVAVGRITRDCGIDQNSYGYIQNGTCYARIAIAVNRSKKNENGEWIDDASFFNVIIWGKLAESLKPRLLKGTQIAVDGYLKQDRWQKDGQNFSSISIVANSVQVLTPKQQQNNSDDYYPPVENKNVVSHQNVVPQKSYQQQGYQSQGYNQTQNNPQEEFPEDIPF